MPDTNDNLTQPKASNLRDAYSHLTNYSLNKHNDAYVHTPASSASVDDAGGAAASPSSLSEEEDDDEQEVKRSARAGGSPLAAFTSAGPILLTHP